MNEVEDDSNYMTHITNLLVPGLCPETLVSESQKLKLGSEKVDRKLLSLSMNKFKIKLVIQKECY